jgi:hypothetical protein
MATGVRQSVPVPRTVEPADIPIIIDNIRREEFAQEHSPETLERIFRYEWLKSKPNLGFVLTVGKRIVAFQALVYSERLVRGETRKFASISMGWVHPEFRSGPNPPPGAFRTSVALATALTTMTDHTLCAFTPRPAMVRARTEVGFETIEQNWLAFRPPLRISLFSPARILDEGPELLMRLTDEQRKIVADHKPYGCNFYLLQCGDANAFIVTKRRTVRRHFLLGNWPIKRLSSGRLPVSDVMHASDWKMARTHWDKLIWHIVLRERTA